MPLHTYIISDALEYTCERTMTVYEPQMYGCVFVCVYWRDALDFVVVAGVVAVAYSENAPADDMHQLWRLPRPPSFRC